MGLSMAERKAVTKQMAGRYARASKAEKGRMLDELCALTGWTRRHARRALTEAANPPPASGRRRGRPPVYRGEVLVVLRKVWATLDGPSGKRLAPFLPEIVQAMERARELQIDGELRAKLLSMSQPRSTGSLPPSAAGSNPRVDRVRGPGAS